ncbi:MAG TPA: EF-P beta-lysylation protein EpmB [Thiomicrospira sp.]|jgi:EF-P beta-lysylation protein EpmB|nr:EF-P beta-lysylation protein EpmB [Thiomicrospira sp.]
MSKNLAKLCKTLQLSEIEVGAIKDASFPLKVPQDFLEQIKPGEANDPLLKQVLPIKAELEINDAYSKDPVGDLLKNPSPALIHKYHGRVLLIASPKCDIHCRYCFRRHFPYQEQTNQRHWQQALKAISEDKTIHEVILSGGDPMSLNENTLMDLIESIEKIEHITTLRIHSRTPIVAPSKAPQNALLAWAKKSRLNKVLVVHCNHANELSEKTAGLLKCYRESGFQLLNQSVLLKGINDSSETLIELSHALFKQDVLPYYLHQLDKVQGASHFEVIDKDALKLMNAIRPKLPGYLVPKLVREEAGKPNKSPI